MTEKLSVNKDLSENFARIEETICESCRMAGRSRNDVQLLAVTKTVSPERINQAISLGATMIGENRVQEFLSKKDQLHLQTVQTHLIGHLQTNKVRQIAGIVDMIESVDSVHLAETISRYAVACGRVMPILVEVNIGNEEAKSGISADELEKLLYDISGFNGIHVKGLMTVPPIMHTETEKRKVFSKMYRLFLDIRSKNIDNIDMCELSMGMSGDYREAILEGATIVRVGSALFGKRVY